MRDPYVECASCEVFGYCANRGRMPCIFGLRWDRSKKPVGCNSCTISMCAQTAAECEAYKEINGVGQVFADAADQQDRLHKLPANLGLITGSPG